MASAWEQRGSRRGESAFEDEERSRAQEEGKGTSHRGTSGIKGGGGRRTEIGARRGQSGKAVREGRRSKLQRFDQERPVRQRHRGTSAF